jgi:excisionase family DNA binding protein
MSADDLDDPANWLTFTEVGRRIGVSRHIVRRMAEDGEFHAHRIGRRRYISAGEVIDYLARLRGQAS